MTQQARHLVALAIVLHSGLALAILMPSAVFAREPLTLSIEGHSSAVYGGSYALVIGAGAYAKGWPRLTNVENEVGDLETALGRHGFGVTKVLHPTGSELRKAMADFINRYGYQRNNRLLIYFSGHGHTRRDQSTNEEKGYLVPVDAPDPLIDLQGFLARSIPMIDVLAWARTIEANHVLFAFDSCFAGTVFQTKALPDPNRAYIRKQTTKPVRQFLTAGDAYQEVPAKSVFTPLFIRAIDGDADFTGDGYVTGSELGVFMTQEVPEYDARLTPQYGKIRDPALDEGDIVFRAQRPRSLPLRAQRIDSKREKSAGFSNFRVVLEDDEVLVVDIDYDAKVPGAHVLLKPEYVGKPSWPFPIWRLDPSGTTWRFRFWRQDRRASEDSISGFRACALTDPGWREIECRFIPYAKTWRPKS